MIFKSEQHSKVGGWASRLFELEIIQSLHMHGFLHGRVVMKKQLTLFGVQKRKRKPFFQRSADDSDYTRVIQTLWQQDAGQCTRKDAFKWSQDQWCDKYSKDRKAKDDVLAKSNGVQQGMHNADKKADRTSYFWQLDEPELKQSHLSRHGHHDQVYSIIILVSSGNTDDHIEVASGGPEAAFLNVIGIDSSQLLPL